jgi:TPR repeat protein/signal transduction histidine kinase
MTEQNTLSISELEQKANAGDAQAQFDLAALYTEGSDDLEKSGELALMWFTKSVEQGHSMGQLILGISYLDGVERKLFLDMKRLYKNKHLLRLGLFFLSSHAAIDEINDAISAFTCFKKAAEHNCKEAQYALARCFQDGIGTDPNEVLAFEWYRQAAEHGLGVAQAKLADCYFEGKFVEKNEETAVEWLKKSADQCFAESQFYLAICYLEGKGVGQSYYDAVEWLEKFKANEKTKNLISAEACFLLKELYIQGRKGINCNQERALELNKEGESIIFPEYYSYKSYWSGESWNRESEEDFKKRVDQEHKEHLLEFNNTWSSVKYHLAKSYLRNKEPEQDFILGIEYMLEAIDAGYTFSENYTEYQYQLALRYFEGKGIDKSYKQGMKRMIIAAYSGYAEANNWLISAYLDLAIPSCLSAKENAEQYYKFAADWCLKELDGHNAVEAYLLLGILYYSGKGVKQSDKQAIECFEKAEYMFHDDPDNNYLLRDFTSLYVGNFYAQGKSIATYCLPEQNVFKYYKDQVASFPFDVFGESFVEGITAMPLRDLHHNKMFLTLLRIAVFKKAGEYELAKAFTKEVFDKTDGMDKNYKEILLTSIEQEQKIAEQNKALEEKNKELNNLVAMFAHNFLGTLQCIRSNAEHDNNPKIHLKTVKMMSGALTAFSIISADDDKLIEQLKQDNTGEITLLQNLANNLALAISQLLSKTNKDKIINLYLNYLQKTAQIKPETNGEDLRFNENAWEKWNALQQQWEDEFNDLFSENVKLSRLQTWLETNFFPVQIIGFNDYTIRFKEYGITDSIFLVVFMEILVNALKYTDVSKNKPLIITLCKENETYQLTCENPSAQETYRGTHKGMDFLKSIARKLNAQFITEATEQQFKTTFIIPAELLD